MSSGDSGSSSSDGEDDGDGNGEQEPDSVAKQRALEEARAMLADRPRSKKKRKNAWFEDEVSTCSRGLHCADAALQALSAYHVKPENCSRVCNLAVSAS